MALGFASFENLGYLGALSGFALFGRAVASPLTHAVFASAWGHSVGCAKLKGKSIVMPALGGLALASVFHGLFNFFTVSTSLRLLGALLILGIWLWVIVKFEKEAKARQRSGIASVQPRRIMTKSTKRWGKAPYRTPGKYPYRGGRKSP